MGTLLDESLAREMASWESAGLRRRLDPGVSGLVDFTSNDYLGLARRPELVAAAREALEAHGVGGRASRLLGGGATPHFDCERAAADWLACEAALLFPTGYQANLGLITTLAERGDAVFSDRLNHASLIDAARLSRARVFVHAHLDLDELAAQLARAKRARRRLVVTEGVFSMDGDAAPLAELHELCARHDAWLVVDEAHSAGLLGPEGAGAWARADTDGARLAARVVTGGKALGVSGALVAGGSELVELVLNRARSFVFTTAPSPAIAAALEKAIELCRSSADLRERALDAARTLATRLGLEPPSACIVPVVVGDAEPTMGLAARLRASGFDVRGVRPPSVPDGTSRLRLVAHATNTEAEIDDLARTLEAHGGTPRAAASEPVASKPPLIVVGTDTDVGKTVVSALLLRAARARGAAGYWKPVQTGTESDTEAVGLLAEARPHELLRPAWQLALPASPHEAAAAEAKSIDPERLAEGLRGLVRVMPNAQLVVELAGGLLVPYRVDEDGVPFTQADWLETAGVPVVLVARAGLGTLNHTALTLEALRARHVEPRALFLVGTPHPSNRATLAETTGIPHVFELPFFDALGPDALDGWLREHDLAPLFDA